MAATLMLVPQLVAMPAGSTASLRDLTVMECLISVCGLLGVLRLSLII